MKIANFGFSRGVMVGIILVPVLLCSALFWYFGFAQKQVSSEEKYKSELIKLGKQKKFEDALQLLQLFKREFPQAKSFQSDMHYHIAFGFYQQGEVARARSVLENAIIEFPEADAILTLYARALIRLNIIDRAMLILERYPNDPNTFKQNIGAHPLNAWATYNISACYALLKRESLSILYLNTALLGSNFSPQKTFFQINKDPDFDSLRDDQRYIVLKQMMLSETFDDAVMVIEKHWINVAGAIKRFNKGELSSSEVVSSLEKSKEGIYGIYTVAPLLIEIQKRGVRYLDRIIQTISNSQELALEFPDAEYQEIASDVQIAMTTQKTGRRPRGDVKN